MAPVPPRPARLGLVTLVGVLCAGLAVASEQDSPVAWRVGDCALFREGGVGRVLRSPTYWLRGVVVGVEERQHVAEVCPQPARAGAPSRTDWQRLADAAPCVWREEERRTVSVTRVTLSVESWETPWNSAHGQSGMLYQGHYLDLRLESGQRIEFGAQWLQRCSEGAGEGAAGGVPSGRGWC